jgi:hypothetical protein
MFHLPPGSAGRRLSIVAAALAIAAMVTVATMLAAAGAATSGSSSPACRASAGSTIASVDSTVADDIYDNERRGTEVSFDLAQITGAPDLRAAVAVGDRAATLAAVKRIVFHPRWHIVRLRVLDAARQLLADVGGPYAIAPVSGVLRSNGRSIGSFVMSVQDDTGFAKLETRFVGDPIGIYVHGKRAVERGGRFPDLAPGEASVTLGGVVYSTVMRTYNAFPNGTLSAVIAVPAPPPALTQQPCAAVIVGALGRVAERIAMLFHPLTGNYPAFVGTAGFYTGAIVVVRIGPRTIAASNGIGPATLPSRGTVNYLGQIWSVFSFAPTPPARIYVLVAQA